MIASKLKQGLLAPAIIALAVFAASCGEDEDSEVGNFDDDSLRFVYENPQGTNDLSLTVGQCGELELGLVDYVVGGQQTAPTDIVATVAAPLDPSWCRRSTDATMTIYSDAACTTPTTTVTIPEGEMWAKLYVMADGDACFQMGARATDVETPPLFFVDVSAPEGEDDTDANVP